VQQLAARLGDPGMVFWLESELSLYLTEALRTWSAYATYWRNRGTFNTVANQPFYDLTGASPQMAALLAYTVTDQQLITEMCYQLMEPPPVVWAGGWVGSEMFTLDDLTQAIQRRRDQFLSETGSVLTRSVINAPSTPVGRVPLSGAVIDVRRVAWMDSGPPVATTPLFRVDEFQMNAGLPFWETNAATPEMYSTIVSPPLTVQLGPVPLNSGQLDMLTVNVGATLNPMATATVLGIPDDLAWVVKMGALADLLGTDGLARDPDRAKYCEDRWQQGCELARINPTIINAEIQGVDTLVDSLWAIDTAMPDWQTTAGQPSVIGTAGRNLVAMGSIPDGIYSATADVVQNAPVTGTYIQIGSELFDAILDYAQHIACFKEQGEEWKATNRAAENMIRQASQYNEKLRASSLFKAIIWPSAHLYRDRQPRRKAAEVSA
jgi:hypothetical protein